MRQIVKLIAGGALTALLLVLALPPSGWSLLAWVALLPLLFACRDAGFLCSFVAGIASSLLMAWISSSGIVYPQKVFSGEPTWLYLGCAMFGFVLAIICGVFGEASQKGALNVRSATGLSGLALCLEFLISKIMPATIALTQASVHGMLLISSFTGMVSVAFLIWFVNISIASRLKPGSFATIDPESPHAYLAALHAAFTPFRAAESGVAIVRADGLAHSMIVDNAGLVLVDLPAQTGITGSALIRKDPRWTFFKATGGLVGWLFPCLVLLLFWRRKDADLGRRGDGSGS
ncbi:hypothetical protein BH11ARM1_BH11ARM1_10310 [soil metagenome]